MIHLIEEMRKQSSTTIIINNSKVPIEEYDTKELLKYGNKLLKASVVNQLG